MVAKKDRRSIPVDTFPLVRCKKCKSTRLKFSKTKTESEGDETVAKKTYVLCLKCGRKSRGIFD